jgi:hypothetical protein
MFHCALRISGIKDVELDGVQGLYARVHQPREADGSAGGDERVSEACGSGGAVCAAVM